MGGARALLLAIAVMAATTSHAQQRDEEGRAAYIAGKEAYEARKYQDALEQFKKSYTLSAQPALLFNVAAALQNLNRPGEAADSLQEFLSLRPNDSDRPELEARITNLRRAQRLLDRDKEHNQKMLDAALKTGWIGAVDVERRLLLIKERERVRRKKLAIGLGVGLGSLAVGGIVVGIVCGLGRCSSTTPKDWDYGKATVTP